MLFSGSKFGLWEHKSTLVLPITLCSDGTKVFYHNGKALLALRLSDGAEAWQSQPTGEYVTFHAEADSRGATVERKKKRVGLVLSPQYGPTMLFYKGVIAYGAAGQLHVYKAQDGTLLWKGACAPSAYAVPPDVIGIDGLLWTTAVRRMDMVGRHTTTGKVIDKTRMETGFHFAHHRCYRMKASGSTILASRAGIELFDVKSGKATLHHWLRGSCYGGILPTNGLLYVPPHNCSCFIRGKMYGFMALAAHDSILSTTKPEHPYRLLQKMTDTPPAKFAPAAWPTYRGEATRHGFVSASIPVPTAQRWHSALGGTLTAPTIADGRVFVADSDSHCLFALDGTSGRQLWTFISGARFDSPPTIHRGLALVGCRDGWIYALRAKDGSEVWRFRAAPQQRFLHTRGQLESQWPVSGSITVANGTAYVVAGRSSYVDGGLLLFGLDPLTGKQKLCKHIYARDTESGAQIEDDNGLVGYLPDVLSFDGKRLFMRHQGFALDGKMIKEPIAHLHSPAGFLDGEWQSRCYWTVAPVYTSTHQGAGYDQRLISVIYPAGNLLVCDEKTAYGYRSGAIQIGKASSTASSLFATARDMAMLDVNASSLRKQFYGKKSRIQFRWTKTLPFRAWGMAVTPSLLLVAGDTRSKGAPPALFRAVDKETGTTKSELPLPATPVWDGTAAAQGHVFIALQNGSVVCLGPTGDA